MALPKLSYPTFEVILPSTNKPLKMRPFLVREEKILLVAQQTEEPKEVVNAIRQVIVNCSIDPINVEDLTTFDLEFLFIKLRARSVNSVIKLRYRDNEDNQSYDVECNLDEVQISRTEGHTNFIQINDNMSMLMRYPRADLMQNLDPSMSESEIFFELLSNCIDEVIENGNHHDAKNSTKEEVEEFIASLDVNTFQKIQEFFQTMPKIKHELKYTNSLGNERTVVLDNINDFFTLG
jgi:hypothetical protein